MSIKNVSLAVAVAILVVSCGGSPSEQNQQENPTALEEQRWEELMAVHDEVMPKMSEINRLSRSLREYKENQEAIDPQVEQRIDAALEDLSTAEEKMWDWMNNLKQLDGLREQQSHEEVMDYLKEEKDAIHQVRNDMLGAIEEAQKITGELELSQPAE